MGRGVVPGGHPLLVTKARGPALGGADLVVVVGTPLDFRLGYGVFGGKDGADAGPGRAPRRLPRPGLAARRAGRRPRAGDLTRGPRRASSPRSSSSRPQARLVRLGQRPPGRRRRGRSSATPRCCGAEADPIHPARIYGELVPRLADDAVVIGDGGDFVQLRRQVRRAEAPRRLARPRPLRLPRRRPRRGHRRPDRAAVRAGGAAARRRRRRLLADGRRHPGPARPAGRHGDGQQLRVGPGEGPDADALRLRRRRRPRRRTPATTRWCAALGGGGETVTDPERDRPGAGPRVRRRACPTWSTSSPTSTRPTRAAPSASDRCIDPAGRGPTSSPRSARSPWTAYERVHRRPARTTTAQPCATPPAATARPSCGSPMDDDELVGTVTYCPLGSPWREMAVRRRGRVPDARRRPGGARPRRRRGAGPALRGPGPADGATRMVLSTPRRDDRGPPHLRTARLRRAPGAGLVPACPTSRLVASPRHL